MMRMQRDVCAWEVEQKHRKVFVLPFCYLSRCLTRSNLRIMSTCLHSIKRLVLKRDKGLYCFSCHNCIFMIMCYNTMYKKAITYM